MEELLTSQYESTGGESNQLILAEGARSQRDRFNLTSDPEDFSDHIGIASGRAEEFAKEAESGSIGQEALDQIRDQVYDLGRQYNRSVVSDILPDITTLQGALFTIIDAGRRKPSELREVYFNSATTSILLAQTAYDVGRLYESMTLSRAAYLCAQNAGHDGLRAWARAQQSVTAHQSGRISEALRYADEAIRISVGIDGSIQPWVHCLRARVLAEYGRSKEAVTSLRHAADARARVRCDDLDEIGGLFLFDEPQQNYYVAGALVNVPGGQAEVERNASAAIEFYSDRNDPHWSYVVEAGSRIELALSRVRAGNPDGALEVLLPVLEISTERRTAGIVAGAWHVQTELSRIEGCRNSSVATEMRARIVEYKQASIKAIGNWSGPSRRGVLILG